MIYKDWAVLTLVNLCIVATALGASSANLRLPLRFEPAVEKAGGSDAYVAHGRNVSLRITPVEMELTIADSQRQGRRAIVTRFVGVHPLSSRIQPSDPYTATANYLVGDRSKWRTAVPLYGKIRRTDLYPGIDLVFHGEDGNIEYDFVIAPGADPRRIRMRVAGGPATIDRDGNLVIGEATASVLWRKPVLYQEIGGHKVPVDGSFALRNSEVGFQVGPFDRSKPLVIDPVINYSSYFGSSGNESARAIATDPNGFVYIAGFTTSPNLPVARNAAQTAYAGGTANLISGDAFVAKFSAQGVLQYVTYLGGSADDAASGIAVDASGNAYISGITTSTNFPVTPGAAQTTFRGFGGNNLFRLGDAFVVKLSPGGNQIIYATFLGGSLDDSAGGIAIDSSGNAYVTGTTLSSNFPTTTGAYQTAYKGGGGEPDLPRFGTPLLVAGDAFVTKIDPSGSQFVFSTLLGGSVGDRGVSIALDKQGNIYVGGFTLSSDFPTTPQAFQRSFAGVDSRNLFFHLGDGFIAKLNPAGSQLIYSTLLGGSGDDMVTAIAVDGAGNVYATGSTSSADFPVVNPLQRKQQGPASITPGIDQVYGDAFVTKLNPTGTALVYSTYLGGSMDEIGTAIAVDNSGNAYVAGMTLSSDFPVTADAAQPKYGGGDLQFPAQLMGDGFLAQINSGGAAITHATFVGGTLDDSAGAIALDKSGNLWMTGTTLSTDFPVRTGADQPAFGGAIQSPFFHGDAFLTRFANFVTSGVNALVNAASNASGAVSPGMIFVVYGNGIGPKDLVGAALTPDGLVDTMRGQTRILVDNTPAPIVYVSDLQSSGIAPYNIAGKSTVQVAVEYNGQRTAPITVPVAAVAPGLFSANQSGTGQGAILNEDGTFNSSTNPAGQGTVVVLFGTGEGQTTPAGIDGKIATDTAPVPVLGVTATVGGLPATVIYAAGAPGAVAGLFQVNIQLPDNLPSGDQPVVVTVGTTPSQRNFTVAVQ